MRLIGLWAAEFPRIDAAPHACPTPWSIRVAVNASPASWLFDVITAPVEVPVRSGGEVKHVRVPSKKALVAADTGQVVGIVGKDYRIVTNLEALELCRKLCTQVFPDSTPAEWELSDASGTKNRSRVALDLKHKTHVMNLWDNPGGISEVHTPFLRVTNSYNGRRALRFDLGFMRKHCSNGVIFEEKVATVTAAHTKDAIEKLYLAAAGRNFGDLKQRFIACLGTLRGIALTDAESLEIVRAVLALPVAREELSERTKVDIEQLDADLAALDARHRAEIGANAYAAFNTMTDFATRPPVSFLVRRDRSTLQGRAGAWLKSLHEAAGRPGFSIEDHLKTLRLRPTAAFTR